MISTEQYQVMKSKTPLKAYQFRKIQDQTDYHLSPTRPSNTNTFKLFHEIETNPSKLILWG